MKTNIIRRFLAVVAVAGFASTAHCGGALAASWTQSNWSAGSGVNIDTTTYPGYAAISPSNLGTWAPKATSQVWNSVAMSSDGTKQTAIVDGGQIYVSVDSGNTWIAKATSQRWYSVAMSADGTKQAAVVAGGQIYVSVDSGNTWTAKASSQYWNSIAMSADGTKQTADSWGSSANSGYIYLSTDSGNTWTATAALAYWEGVAMSADGTKQTAVISGPLVLGDIYVSSDSGDTWTPKATAQNWRDVAMSADGTKQTAVVAGGQIYVSADSGNTWTPEDSSRNWFSVAMSADGTKQTAVVYGGQIYISADSGNTWNAQATSQDWGCVAMSSDGTKQTAVVWGGGQIYVNTNIDFILNASYTSTPLNAGSSCAAWGNFVVVDSQPVSSSISYYAITATSTYNLSTNPSFQLTNGGAINSTVGPYMVVIASFSRTNPTVVPMISSFTVTWVNGNLISGWVVEPDSATPIPAATVEALWPPTTYYAQTNSAGYYQILAPCYNNWVVNVSSMPGLGVYTFSSAATMPFSNISGVVSGIDFVRNNTAPELSWTGSSIAYISAGVAPNSGASNTTFTFEVLYKDAENDPPKSGYPRVYILNGGTTVQTLTLGYPGGGNFTTGVICSSSTLLPPAAAYSYYFVAQDTWGLTATGIPTSFQAGYPQVLEAVSPLLSFTNEPNYTGAGVYPASGNVNTAFSFHVMYSGSCPPVAGYPKVNILNGGTTVYCFGMNQYSGSYATGAVYSTSTYLAPCSNYTYNFQACDTNGIVSTSTVTGSFQVSAPKPDGPQSMSPGLTNGASITSGQAVFSWACANPDNEELTYTLFLSNPQSNLSSAKGKSLSVSLCQREKTAEEAEVSPFSQKGDQGGLSCENARPSSAGAEQWQAPGNFNIVYTGPGTSHTVNSLESGMVYYWQVQAANQYGMASESPVYSFDTVKAAKRAYTYPKFCDPARGQNANIVFEMEEDGDADITIFSEFGNRCWGHNYSGLRKGTNQISYDGKDDSGNIMYNGTYPVVIIKRYPNGQQTDHCRVLIIK